MAMRPRTFRRLVLAGSFVALLLAGAGGYFIIAPMQERKNIERLRTTGMRAYEAGDYATATRNLGRYRRNVKPAPADVVLAFARAQAKVEANNGGHLRVSIGAYRDYLLQHPDDLEASMELLHLFNRTRMWHEARELAESLQSMPGIDLKSVLHEEITARKFINADDPEIGPLFERLLAMGEAEFAVIWAYSEWLNATGREEESLAFLDEMIDAHPEQPGPKILYTIAGNRLANTLSEGAHAVGTLVGEFEDIIGWDAESYAWNDGAELGSLDLGRMVARIFDLLGRGDLALEVVAKTALETHDPMTAGWYARRLWWMGSDERLLAIEQETAEVLGFKALAATRLGDAQTAEITEQMLGSIDTDFRAKGWAIFLQGKAEFDQGNPVEARGLLTKAIDTNPMEPTFYLVMGDIQSALGREDDAQSKWGIATELSLPAIWPEPSLRIVSSLQRSGHLSEAGSVARSLFLRAPLVPQVRFAWLQSQSAMAREGLLDARQIETAINFSLQLVEYLPANEQELLSTILAVLYAESGRHDDAVAELSRTLHDSPSSAVFGRIVELDQYYDLGVIDQDADGAIEIAIGSPQSALGYARRMFLLSGDRQQALDIFAQGLAADSDADSMPWDLAQARFLDSIGDEEAADQWRTILAKHDGNIEILLSVLDSNALGLDIVFVEKTIARILELTSSKGRVEPTRLRLARARAIAGGKMMTRSTRNKALAVVRSVIASDSKNIKARLMLSNILDMECSPELVGDDRFERDRAGAAAEKLMISRLIAGPVARDYLFRVSQLNVDLGDNEAARQNLLEAYARSVNDIDAQFKIIHELRRAGEFQLAIPRLTDLIQRAEGVQKADFQIALARMLGGLNRRTQMLPVLNDLLNSETLTRTQLIDLVNLFFQTGNTELAEQVVSRANEYGLNEHDTRYARFQYAKMIGATGDAESILRSMIADDASDIEAWSQLASLFRQDNRLDEARLTLEKALEQNPDNKRIKYDLALLSGDRSQINQMVADSESFASAEAKLAMQMIVDFENARSTLSREDSIEELERLGALFPNLIAAQRYVFGTLLTVGIDLKQIGTNAEAAARRLGSDVVLLELATRAYARAGDWVSVLRTTDAWRGRTTESPIQPDVFAARAAYETGDSVRAKQILSPYFKASAQNTDDPMHRELLLIYSKASIAMREPLGQLTADLEPIALASASFRNTVWLNLASSTLPEYEEASRWIELAQAMNTDESFELIVEAWLQLAQRFPRSRPEILSKALTVGEQWLASDAESPIAQSMVARILRTMAESLGHQDPQSVAYLTRAQGLFDDAALQDPQNLNHLFNAAQCASTLGEYDGAITRYRTLMESEGLDGLFEAAVKNNLARAIEQQSKDDASLLAEASALVHEAIAFQEHPAFLGTLGWIELKLGNQSEAADLFRKVLAKDPDSVEGWAGLAAALHENDKAESLRAITQVERLTAEERLDPSILARWEYFGVGISAP